MQHSGYVEEGYGPVADAFARNFAEAGEIGAAVTVFAGGRKVVDLWGGVADERTGRAWEEHTAVPVMSASKGIVGVCAHLLAQQGRLDLDAPVARYWPEFGREGKEGITTRMILGHRAGLPVLDATPAFEEILGWTGVVRALEEQKPLWEPGTAHEYHGHTIGWLVGEVIRRIAGLTPGRFFRSAIADDLGLTTWIGVPEAELPGLARLSLGGAEPVQLPPDSLFARILTMNGELVFPGIDDPRGWNSPALLTAEIPGTGGVSSARGLATTYAAAVTGVDGGERLLSAGTVTDAVRVQSSGPSWSGFPDLGVSWGSGFHLDSGDQVPMLGPRSFGHDGAGGHLGFGDDEFGVGFGYVANRMIGEGDERAVRLVAAVRECLGR
ncbi:beta-lactamase family protein [Streptomyces sp. AV19]|uniref:serine hydrolase domain-containing protein n=1 Tax=Streptomyces sp. AV19 TaxID=2793068 RepID=UPI0018FEE47A|nr:serine hydrolase domain-containing protein [Streptomyces sp. AV19]MBH1933732.1 beta-lactamase family protein [Streptomyces sp. AV19]MDG4535763.1 beta-lactamase family protein [Streptomyces sp. AV19]